MSVMPTVSRFFRSPSVASYPQNIPQIRIINSLWRNSWIIWVVGDVWGSRSMLEYFYVLSRKHQTFWDRVWNYINHPRKETEPKTWTSTRWITCTRMSCEFYHAEAEIYLSANVYHEFVENGQPVNHPSKIYHSIFKQFLFKKKQSSDVCFSRISSPPKILSKNQQVLRNPEIWYPSWNDRICHGKGTSSSHPCGSMISLACTEERWIKALLACTNSETKLSLGVVTPKIPNISVLRDAILTKRGSWKNTSTWTVSGILVTPCNCGCVSDWCFGIIHEIWRNWTKNWASNTCWLLVGRGFSFFPTEPFEA